MNPAASGLMQQILYAMLRELRAVIWGILGFRDYKALRI